MLQNRNPENEHYSQLTSTMVLSRTKEQFKATVYKSPNEVQRTILAKAQMNLSKFAKLPGNPIEGGSLRGSNMVQ